MHAEISPGSELRLTITVRDSVAGLHAVLIFDDKKFKKNMTGIVDSEAFKLWVEVVSDEYLELPHPTLVGWGFHGLAPVKPR